MLNHNELYLHDHGNGNYSISFRDTNLAILLEILPVQNLEGKSPVYRGEISGWAETGANRVEFILKDKQGGSGIELNDPLSADTVVEFLKKVEMDWIYAQIRQTCHEKAGETDRLYQKVSEALDDIL